MDAIILNRDDLEHDNGTDGLEGYKFGANVSIILVDMQPGNGVRLHSHPYEEIFIIQEGRATYTVGSKTLELQAGQMVVVPPGTPHKFVNSGEGNLRQVDVHVSKQFVTDWLED